MAHRLRTTVLVDSHQSLELSSMPLLSPIDLHLSLFGMFLPQIYLKVARKHSDQGSEDLVFPQGHDELG